MGICSILLIPCLPARHNSSALLSLEVNPDTMSFALLKAFESPSLAWPTAAPAASLALFSTSWSTSTLLNQGCDTRQAMLNFASILL